MRTIIYAFICVTLVLLFFIPFFFAWAFVAPFQKDNRVMSAMTTIYTKIIIYSSPWWKLKVNGIENMKSDIAYVIMPNHQSMLDIPIICTLNRNLLWVSKKEILYVPIVNFVLMMRGDIIIKRGTVGDAKKMLKKCRATLKKGISVTICPEGTRSKDGKIHSFKEGAFVAAKLGNSDILPIVLDGPYDITNNKGKFGLMFPATITINILEPISKESFKDEQVKDLKDRVHDIMLSYHKTIRPDLYE